MRRIGLSLTHYLEWNDGIIFLYLSHGMISFRHLISKDNQGLLIIFYYIIQKCVKICRKLANYDWSIRNTAKYAENSRTIAYLNGMRRTMPKIYGEPCRIFTNNDGSLRNAANNAENFEQWRIYLLLLTMMMLRGYIHYYKWIYKTLKTTQCKMCNSWFFPS